MTSQVLSYWQQQHTQILILPGLSKNPSKLHFVVLWHPVDSTLVHSELAVPEMQSPLGLFCWNAVVTKGTNFLRGQIAANVVNFKL